MPGIRKTAILFKVSLLMAFVSLCPQTTFSQVRSSLTPYIENRQSFINGMRSDIAECKRKVSNGELEKCDYHYACGTESRRVSENEATMLIAAAEKDIEIMRAAAPEVARLENRVARDARSIEYLGFDVKVEEILRWQNIAEKSRDEYRKANMMALFDALLTKVSATSNLVWKEGSADEFIGFLRSPAARESLGRLRINADDLISTVRKLADQGTDAKTKAQLLDLFADQLGKIKSGLEIGFSGDQATALLGIMKTGLTWVLKNPAHVFLVIEIEWVAAGASNFLAQWMSDHYITSLTGKIEADLKLLKKRQEFLAASMTALKEYKASMRDQMECKA